MTDELEARLRAADPMRTADPGEWSPSRLADLVEATMNEPKTSQRRSWAVPAAAAVLVALAVGGVAVAQTVRDESGSAGSASAAAMELTVQGAGTSLGTCIPFSIGTLSEMPVAFSGSVVDLGEGRVLLEVDHWYRGGSVSQVELTSPDLSRVALDGAVTFAAGQRYLVTATDGVVNACGYTAVWSSDTAAAFDTAFT